MRHWWARLRGTHDAVRSAPAHTGGRSATDPTSAALDAERTRIYQDLHDDIGARLVSILSVSQDERIRELARAALQDLREVVYHARGEPGTLEQVLGEIRGELATRLELAGWQLAWTETALPDVLLPGDCTIHLYRILREASTNAIKHAAPGTLRVRVRHSEGMIYLDITDQGGLDEAGSGTGSGQRGMRDRAERLGGAIEIGPGTQCGTKVVLRFPLPVAPPALRARS